MPGPYMAAGGNLAGWVHGRDESLPYDETKSSPPILGGERSLSKNPIIKLRNTHPRLQKSKNISQKLASKGVSTPSLQAFSDSWQQI